MRHTPRVLVSGAVTGLLALGLAGAPAQASETRKEKRAEKRQNSNIKKNTRAITRLRTSTKQTTDALGKLVVINADENRKNTATINAALPVVTSALTQLRDGLTAAGAGLQTLGSAFQSVEYGVARVFVTGGTVTSNSTNVSADVPDDGNPNTTTGTTAFIAGGASTTIDFRAIIRSNEADGVAGAGPVGQVGGSLYVKNLTNGQFTPCGAPYGASGGFAGTPTGASIVTPSGPVTNLNLVNIAEGSPRTDTAGPTASSTNIIPAPCTVATTGGAPYEIAYAANFVDVPTSTTPGPRD